jgi:thiol-disulfide isomerase/thioredoxin
VNLKQWIAIILALLSVSLHISDGWSETSSGLNPGDMAPSIEASKWLRGGPVDEFESGQVYVVDLWSTWCKPCIASMPTLHELETKYAGKVTVIAMTVWEFAPQGVPKFMESLGDTMPTIVALDSIPEGKEVNEGLTAVKYLGTSDSASIPKSFLIDESGRVAWIGTPENLEEPLSHVLAGTWDLKSFSESYSRQQAASENGTAAD